MPSRTCQALIFDLDGVLIDSNGLYERQWSLWARRHDIPFAHIQSVHHGRPPESTIKIVAPHLDAIQGAQAFRDGLQALRTYKGVDLFPGVTTLLQQLPPDAWAIATSAPKTFAFRLIDYVCLPRPRVVVTCDDVTLGKPHPMPYLQAAQGLGVDADRTVVIEDAPAGVAAARAAGAYVIGVLTTNTSEALQEAHSITESVSNLSVQQRQGRLTVHW